MLFRMLSLEQTPMKGLERKVRQLFVTQSRVLAGRVKDYFLQLLDTLDAAQQTPEQIEAIQQDKKPDLHIDLVDLDEDHESKMDLPARFSDLEDRHFPLFLTFDQVCARCFSWWLIYRLEIGTSRSSAGSSKAILRSPTRETTVRNSTSSQNGVLV
jgi:hypothetical protein